MSESKFSMHVQCAVYLPQYPQIGARGRRTWCGRAVAAMTVAQAGDLYPGLDAVVAPWNLEFPTGPRKLCPECAAQIALALDRETFKP